MLIYIDNYNRVVFFQIKFFITSLQATGTYDFFLCGSQSNGLC